jgi:ribosomal protein S27E
MASKKAVKSEPKLLKLVCRCGTCKHWEIIYAGGTLEVHDNYIVCMSCGVEIPCTFYMDPHASLHWEKQGKEEK